MKTERKDKPETAIPMEETICALCGSSRSEIIARGHDYQYWTSPQIFTIVKCADCGHLYQNPRPVIEAADLIYPSDYYTRSGRHTRKSSRLIAAFKEKIIRRRLNPVNQYLKPKARLLEVGCGDCELLLNLKKAYPEIEVEGIDLAVNAEVRQRCREAGITVTETPAETAVLPENSYDLIIMNQLIEHLWRPGDLLKRLHRSLRPGGALSIETINTAGYDRKLFKNGRWGAFYFPRHLNLFNFVTLARFLNNNNFRVTRQFSLLAPINWAFNWRAFFSPVPEKKNTIFARFFVDSNPVCLAVFTLVDLIALAAGLTTSNQKTIAVKENEVTGP